MVKKRRVMGFFGTLVAFVVVLLVIQSTAFKEITGFNVKDLESETPQIVNENKDFGVNLVSYGGFGDKVRVYYTIQDYRNALEEISVDFKIIKENIVIKEGTNKVVVEPGSVGKYIFESTVPEGSSGSVDLQLTFSDGAITKDVRINNILVLSSPTITGNAVGAETGRRVSIAGLIVIVLALVFFLASRYYRRKDNLYKVSKSIDHRHIKIDLGAKKPINAR